MTEYAKVLHTDYSEYIVGHTYEVAEAYSDGDCSLYSDDGEKYYFFNNEVEHIKPKEDSMDGKKVKSKGY